MWRGHINLERVETTCAKGVYVSQLTMPLEVDVCLAWREGTAIRCFACKWKGLSSDSVALFNLQNFRCLPVLCHSKFKFKSSGSPSTP